MANTKLKYNSYSFNRTLIPFPEDSSSKIKPPIADIEMEDNSHLFQPVILEERKLEQARQYIDTYRKAERAVIINFYTGGGGAYRKGFMDAIYKGYNFSNPPKNT